MTIKREEELLDHSPPRQGEPGVGAVTTECAAYPVILGGDHAAFEAEWAARGRPAHERPDWPLPSFDARDWAKAFCTIAKTHGHDIDEEWMVTWFANALMRGYDQRTAEVAKILDGAKARAAS